MVAATCTATYLTPSIVHFNNAIPQIIKKCNCLMRSLIPSAQHCWYKTLASGLANLETELQCGLENVRNPTVCCILLKGNLLEHDQQYLTYPWRSFQQ